MFARRVDDAILESLPSALLAGRLMYYTPKPSRLIVWSE